MPRKKDDPMIFVMDVGNTNTVVGIYREEKLLKDWRLGTVKARTTDEYGIMVQDLFSYGNFRMSDIGGVIISCVVPPMTNMLEDLSRKYFNTEALFVGPGIKTGMPILLDNPREVGADRIVNAVAAFDKWRGELIVVDFGTATTFDYVTAKGEYAGGSIAPGLVISAEALFREASKLPRVDLHKPDTVIGKNTIHSMQSGIIFGYAGLVDSIVARMKAELRSEPKVVATGGLAKLIAPETQTIDEVDDYLTLEGLKILYYRNRK